MSAGVQTVIRGLVKRSREARQGIRPDLSALKERVYPSPFFYVISFKLYDIFIICFINERRFKMRNRINSKVTLTDIHHRINRRAMLFSMLDEEWELYRETNNWMIEDQHLNNIRKIEEAPEY